MATEKKQCKPITVYKVEIASKKSLTQQSGNYVAKYKGKDYKLPQEYEGDSACTPTEY